MLLLSTFTRKQNILKRCGVSQALFLMSKSVKNLNKPSLWLPVSKVNVSPSHRINSRLSGRLKRTLRRFWERHFRHFHLGIQTWSNYIHWTLYWMLKTHVFLLNEEEPPTYKTKMSVTHRLLNCLTFNNIRQWFYSEKTYVEECLTRKNPNILIKY